MTRLLEILVALIIVFVLAVIFGVLLPDHRHIERTVEVSSPVRQIYDVLSGFRTYPSWNALKSYDQRVQLTFEGPEQGPTARVRWTSADARIGNGNLVVDENPQQDKQVKWKVDNNWRGTGKVFTFDIDPSTSGKTVKVTLGFDVDYGWDLPARYTGMYLEGDPATQIQIQLANLQNMLATFPNVDYKEQVIEIKDVAPKPLLFVSTKAKRDVNDIVDATDKAMLLLQAEIKKDKLNVVGPRTTITTNYGDENYEFDVALPIDRADLLVNDPIKIATSYSGKALVTSFTGAPGQGLPLARLRLRAYAYTHGYVFDESTEGPGRFFDELISDPKAADSEQAFNVYLPIQLQQ